MKATVNALTGAVLLLTTSITTAANNQLCYQPANDLNPQWTQEQAGVFAPFIAKANDAMKNGDKSPQCTQVSAKEQKDAQHLVSSAPVEDVLWLN